MMSEEVDLRYRVDVIIEKDEDGYYAYCPALPGCQSQGQTFEEAYGNIREAAELYWQTLSPMEAAQFPKAALGTWITPLPMRGGCGEFSALEVWDGGCQSSGAASSA
jgi:predicted RNase H-like HicB family nuclease